MNKYTLGNMGGAEAICYSTTFMSETSSIIMECNEGLRIELDVEAENT